VDDDEHFEAVEELRDLYIARATGNSEYGDDDRYRELRKELVDDPRVKDRLPAIVRRFRGLDPFWPFIKGISPKYEGRRVYLTDLFAPILDHLEFGNGQAGDEAVTDSLAVLSSEHVQFAWTKALDRRNSDPEGAITAARSLLESVCKHILDDLDIAYEDKDDLPALYTKTAKAMNLSPSQHTEDVFKRILGGAQSVVEGLGTMRNRLSDSHGKGRKDVKPKPRHATLAVNLAGSVAQYLVETWAARSEGGSAP
jgi:abortive infection Abi-like protein